jgi:hypothetical protein
MHVGNMVFSLIALTCSIALAAWQLVRARQAALDSEETHANLREKARMPERDYVQDRPDYETTAIAPEKTKGYREPAARTAGSLRAENDDLRMENAKLRLALDRLAVAQVVKADDLGVRGILLGGEDGDEIEVVLSASGKKRS